jgi:hypothetical protein
MEMFMVEIMQVEKGQGIFLQKLFSCPGSVA